MKGGTYAEALKVGFNKQQAVFLSRLSAETRDETVEFIRDADGRIQERRRASASTFLRRVAVANIIILVGIAIGVLLK